MSLGRKIQLDNWKTLRKVMFKLSEEADDIVGRCDTALDKLNKDPKGFKPKTGLRQIGIANRLLREIQSLKLKVRYRQ